MKLVIMLIMLDQQYYLIFMRVVMKKWYKVLYVDDEDIVYDRLMGWRKLEGNGVLIMSNFFNLLFQEFFIWVLVIVYRNGRVENFL